MNISHSKLYKAFLLLFSVIIVNDLSKELLLKSIRDLDLRRKRGCLVIGFKILDNEYVINPEAGALLIPKSKLNVLGNSEQIQNLNKLF